jgi:hypothetical protein
MHHDVSRLVGVKGIAVTSVADRGRRVELEVERFARAGCCRWCGRGSLVVKERDRVRARDLPFGGRMTYRCWRSGGSGVRRARGRSPRPTRRCGRASGSASVAAAHAIGTAASVQTQCLQCVVTRRRADHAQTERLGPARAGGFGRLETLRFRDARTDHGRPFTRWPEPSVLVVIQRSTPMSCRHARFHARSKRAAKR